MIENTIYLASKSPRRKFLLEDSGFSVKIIDIDVEETYPESLEPSKVAEYIAQLKADETINYLSADQIGVTADTIVVLDGKILEKPKDALEAQSMIRQLRNTSHAVYTGVVVICNGKKHSFTVESKVFVGNVSHQEIDFYIKKYKPYDKAGSYGIQEWFGYTQIERIEGSYTNIMGLPMHELYNELLKIIKKT